MYNGIGLQTPRGSGTNGHVQRNVAFMRARPDRIQYNTEATIARQVKALDRMPNSDILDHERKRQIEVKVAELVEAMREQKFDEAEITERAQALRDTLTAKANRAIQSESGVTSSLENASKAKLQYNEHGRLTGRNTHEVTAATNERNRKLREAFRIGEYAPPPVVSKEQLEQARNDKYTKQYAIVPDAEVVDESAKEHREKQEELLKLRQMEVLYKDHEKHARATQEPSTTGSIITSKAAGGSTVASSNTTAENAQLKKALKRLLKTERTESKQKAKETRDSRRDPSISSSHSGHSSGSFDTRRGKSGRRNDNERESKNSEQPPARHAYAGDSSVRPPKHSTKNGGMDRETREIRKNGSRSDFLPDEASNDVNQPANHRSRERFDGSKKLEDYAKSSYNHDHRESRVKESRNSPERRGRGGFERDRDADQRRNDKNDAERARPPPQRRSRSSSLNVREPRTKMRLAQSRHDDDRPTAKRNRRSDDSSSGSIHRERSENRRPVAKPTQQRNMPKPRSRSPTPTIRERQGSASRRHRRDSSSSSHRSASPLHSRSTVQKRRRPSMRNPSRSESPVRYDLDRKDTSKRARRRSASTASSERKSRPIMKSIARRRSPTTSLSSRSRSRSRTPRRITKPVPVRTDRQQRYPSSHRKSATRSPLVSVNDKRFMKHRRSRSRSSSSDRRSRSVLSTSLSKSRRSRTSKRRRS